jgi:predicted RNA polymerase sigma factor
MSAASRSPAPHSAFGDWPTSIDALYRALNNFHPTPQPMVTRNGERATCHLLGPEQGILMPALAAVLGAAFDLLASWS